MSGKVEIININANSDSIISAAGRISTTEGTADEIYARSCGNDSEKNGKLIKKILLSGHSSVMEHVCVNLSFNNVSVFVEQFMIEFRLASFTVKSRRYVDFSGMGYYEPIFGDAQAAKLYKEHMEFLFGEYAYFVDANIPKEDARFVLPYSFRSNFYCTANLRELIHIIEEMLGERGAKYPEIVEIGNALANQLIEKMPYLEEVIIPMKKEFTPLQYTAPAHTVPKSEDLITIIHAQPNPEHTVCMAHMLNNGKTADNNDGIIKSIIASERRRELEQVNFTVKFNDVSLAGITHMVRHRMQSIIIPEFVKSCSFSNYVMPDSIINAGEQERYIAVFRRSEEVCDKLMLLGMYGYDKVYLLLSGMTASILTTMNANELLTFFKLRTCNRAQWEIKRYADELLIKLRKKSPMLFSHYGPSCFVLGYCPEGKMTCGELKNVKEKYSKI